MYKIIYIKPSGRDWKITILDHASTEYSLPDPISGSFIYNTNKMGDKTAFLKLRECMLKKYNDQVIKLATSSMKLLNINHKSIGESNDCSQG